MSNRWAYLLVFAGLSGMMVVGLGAFAAHGLKSVLSGYLLEVFKTGVQYQAWHTFAVIACAVLIRGSKLPESAKRAFQRVNLLYHRHLLF